MEWKVLVNSQTIRDIIQLVTNKNKLPENCAFNIEGNDKVPDGYYLINDGAGELVCMGSFDVPDADEKEGNIDKSVASGIKEITKRNVSPWKSSKNCELSGVLLDKDKFKKGEQVMCRCGRIVATREHAKGGALILSPHYTDAAMENSPSRASYLDDQFYRNKGTVKKLDD